MFNILNNINLLNRKYQNVHNTKISMVRFMSRVSYYIEIGRCFLNKFYEIEYSLINSKKNIQKDYFGIFC